MYFHFKRQRGGLSRSGLPKTFLHLNVNVLYPTNLLSPRRMGLAGHPRGSWSEAGIESQIICADSLGHFEQVASPLTTFLLRTMEKAVLTYKHVW